jgi:NAD+ diphosphatase
VRPGFTGAGIDRADHLRLDAEQLTAALAHPDARLLSMKGLDPELDQGSRLVWREIGNERLPDLIFLGYEAGAPRFAPLLDAPPSNERAWRMFKVLGEMQPREAAIWGAARALNEWHMRNRFCGVCGQRSAPFRAGWGRKCSACGAEQFPRIDPVVIMLAEHGGRVLLGRQPQYPPGRYSALAGFVEPGESIEEAVAREIEEEAGLEVDNVRYVASQPWPFPHSLMIACIATARSDRVTLDTNELEDAIWVDRAGVRAALAGEAAAPFLAPPPYAIAHTLLCWWMDQSADGVIS